MHTEGIQELKATATSLHAEGCHFSRYGWQPDAIYDASMAALLRTLMALRENFFVDSTLRVTNCTKELLQCANKQPMLDLSLWLVVQNEAKFFQHPVTNLDCAHGCHKGKPNTVDDL